MRTRAHTHICAHTRARIYARAHAHARSLSFTLLYFALLYFTLLYFVQKWRKKFTSNYKNGGIFRKKGDIF